ncbi:hypothetical protein FPOA_00114 [Fusarium poae]|uniref:NACHT domain-containing protein n=1 Tax=Fusarium poae TaxID=36050 RepID=A0A1B8B0E3_FUSPO|nr:hypothetical protein FPOA_00114 [Fusarium poae]
MTSVNITGGSTGLVAQTVTADTLNFTFGADNESQDRNALDEWIRNAGLVNVDGVLEAIKASKQRVSGTCQWLHNREEYRNWLDGNERNRLWISADPGAGKTTTLTAMIDELRRSSDDDSASIVLFFFFDDKVESQSSATTATLSLIGQLLKQQPQLFEHVRGMARPDLDNLSSLWGCLRNMTDALRHKIYIFLDALDECRTSQDCDILRYLNDEASPLGAKILVSCRPDVTKPQSYLGIQIQVDDIQDDVRRVIDSRMEELANYPSELRRQIKSRLYSATDRTFLWVSLLIEYLKTEPPDQFLSRNGSNYISEESLHKVMPAKLSEVYDRILNKITSAHSSRRVRFILNCVVAARRPLTKRELAMAYSLGWKMNQCHSIPDSNLLGCREHIWTLCKPILFLDDKSGTVNLVHQTAKEHLMQSCLMRDWSISDFRQLDLLSTPWVYDFRETLQFHLNRALPHRFHINIFVALARTIFIYFGVLVASSQSETGSNQANRLMFQVCWRYIRMTTPDGNQDTVNVGDNRNKCFYGYAYTEWQQHFLELDQTTTYLLFPYLAKVPSLRKKLAHGAAVSYGKADVLRLLVKAGTDVTEPDEAGSTALDKAIHSGQPESASVLVEAGCSVTDKPMSSMLQWTASHRIITLFFNHELKTVEANGMRKTAFEFQGNGLQDWIEIASAIIGLETTAKVKDSLGWTALHWATILSSSKKASIQSVDKENMFKVVGKDGLENIAKIAVTKNARADVKDRFGWTAFHWAAILSSCANVYMMATKTSPIQQGLEIRSTKGEESVAKLLAVKGDELVVRDNFGFTALHWLALLCSTEGFVMTLEKDTGEMCAITAKGGYTAVAGIISAIGVDWSTKDCLGKTAYDWVSFLTSFKDDFDQEWHENGVKVKIGIRGADWFR